jgi:hypothetical protein
MMERRKAKEAASAQSEGGVAEAAAAEVTPTDGGKRSPEEIKAQREAMMERRQARAAGSTEAEASAPTVGKAEPTAPAETTPPAQTKRTPEEIKAQRDAMMAKRQAREAGIVEPEPAEPPKAQATPAEAESSTAEPEPEAPAPKRTPEEVRAMREEMLAKRQARGEGNS